MSLINGRVRAYQGSAARSLAGQYPRPTYQQPYITVYSATPAAFANVSAGVLDAIVAGYLDQQEFETYYAMTLTQTAILIYDAASPGTLQTFEVPNLVYAPFSPFYEAAGQYFFSYTYPDNVSAAMTALGTNGGRGILFNWNVPATALPGPQFVQIPLTALSWIYPK